LLEVLALQAIGNALTVMLNGGTDLFEEDAVGA